MGKIYGICDFRRGKIGDLVFRKVADKNIVSEKANYYPVNSSWLKKEEFKKYVLSLLNEGIPQIYLLQELPEEIYPYALIFLQNGGKTDVYVDKEGKRTLINLEGGGEATDAVDIVNNVPQDPKNNTIYFVNNNANKEKKELKDTPLECDIYVCDNNVLRKVEVDYTEALNEAKAYTDEKVLSLSGAEIVTSLPAEMVENKLYFVTRSSSLSQDFFYVYIKQNGQLYYLGEIQHYPGSNKKLWFKQVFMIIPQSFPNPILTVSLNYYLPNSFEATYEEIWNYLGELGCVDKNHLYPVAGYYGSGVFCGIFKTGAETYKRIGYTMLSGSNINTSYFEKSTKLQITSTVIKIL